MRLELTAEILSTPTLAQSSHRETRRIAGNRPRECLHTGRIGQGMACRQPKPYLPSAVKGRSVSIRCILTERTRGDVDEDMSREPISILDLQLIPFAAIPTRFRLGRV